MLIHKILEDKLQVDTIKKLLYKQYNNMKGGKHTRKHTRKHKKHTRKYKRHTRYTKRNRK